MMRQPTIRPTVRDFVCVLCARKRLEAAISENETGYGEREKPLVKPIAGPMTWLI